MALFVIGLTGAAGSGKSTVAQRLVGEWGGHRHPFAGPLKRMIVHFLEGQGVGFSVAWRMVDGDLKEVPSDHLGGETPRRAMQTLGTEWGRGLSPSLWIDAWRHSAEDRAWKAAVDGETILLVAADVRFPNEVEAIRALGGIVVRLVRPGAGLSGASGAHPSETTDLGAPDMEILNDGDLDWLRAQTDAIAANVME